MDIQFQYLRFNSHIRGELYMRERYNLDQLLKEIKDDEKLSGNQSQTASQEDIQKMILLKKAKRKNTQ
jgi:hypothetical protein